jgi:hypothetical protein
LSSEINWFVAEADAVVIAEGRIWMPDMRGHQEPPESDSDIARDRGTLSKGFPRNLGKSAHVRVQPLVVAVETENQGRP